MNHRTITVLILSLVLVAMTVVVCRADVSVHLVAKISLSKQKPVDTRWRIKLIAIFPDGTTTIEHIDTATKFSARLGAYFHSLKGDPHEFGTQGLMLESASAVQGNAVLLRNYSMSFKDEAEFKQFMGQPRPPEKAPEQIKDSQQIAPADAGATPVPK